MVTSCAITPSSVPVQDAEIGVCPLCGGRAALAFSAVDRNREITAQPFRYRRCRDCAVYSLVDVPLDLGSFYPAEYYKLLDVAALEDLRWVEEHKVARIRAHVPSGRLVEIGPGPGVFAYAAQRAGYHVTAIEMDLRAGRHLREEVGVETIISDDPATALAGLPATNVVAMWHVIEHLPNPWEVVAAAAERLEPGGALVIAAPNPDALQFRLLKARWAHVDAPRHLFLLPLRKLSERCAALGLRQAAVTTADPAGRHWNRFGWEYAARRRPAAGPAPRPLALAALAVTLAMRPVEHSGLRGAAYTAVYVKR